MEGRSKSDIIYLTGELSLEPAENEYLEGEGPTDGARSRRSQDREE